MKTEPPALDLEEVFAAAQLPALPQSAIRLLQISQDVEAGPAELAVAMSALLPSGADPFWLECGVLEDYYQRLVPADGPALATLLGQIDDEFRELAPLLKAGNPRMSLVERYQEAIVPQPTWIDG